MTLIIIEPFYGGSHKQLIDVITDDYLSEGVQFQLYTLPAKKWHWRARTSALYFSQKIERVFSVEDILFCSSVLNLAEFVALRPDVAACRKKIIYFHENQLVYPVKKARAERDFQYGYNQIISALAADQVVFNSNFNQKSFLESIQSFLRLQPDHRPDPHLIKDKILAKSSVLYFPVAFSMVASAQPLQRDLNQDQEGVGGQPLHIVWPHRWEYDKDPDTLFKVLFQLKDEGATFRVSILGQAFEDVPPIFDEAKAKLSGEILHFGSIEDRLEYTKVLQQADVVVSTALHEFFGVAMMEATVSGCYPILPDRLVYPEIYPSEHLYRTTIQLEKKLRHFCQRPHLPRQLWNKEMAMQTFKKFHPDALREQYLNLLI